MVDLFVPNGYCSSTFWNTASISDNENILETSSSSQQPYSVYHLSQPHFRRIKYDHLGASPLCRASVSKSMQLLRKVLQPAINQDIVKVLEKYILVFREAAENASENMAQEPFSTSPPPINVDVIVSELCQDVLLHAKTLFTLKENKDENKATSSDAPGSASKNSTLNKIPTHLLHNGKRRVASPDFPWQKRLKDDNDVVSQRRSLSPVPKKRFKNVTPVVAPRRYGSPHRNTKDSLRRKIENWNPARLNLNTEFVMGTKANRALGLGATRGRIYMKHPDLFKYAGDHEDKKWMVKNNCMAATGGKNTFLMMAEDVMHLYETEYKDSPGIMPEELQFFKLPEFVLEKMRASMLHEKKLRLRELSAGASSAQDAPLPREAHSVPTSYKHHPVQRTVRQAAQAAAAAINAASDSPEENPENNLSSALQIRNQQLNSDSDSNLLSDDDMA